MWGGETGEGLMVEEEMKETHLAGGVKRHRESIYEEKKRRDNLIKYTNKWYEKISLSDNIASNPIAEINEFIMDTRKFEQNYGGPRRAETQGMAVRHPVKPKKVQKGIRRSVRDVSVKGNFKVVVDPLTGLFKVESGDGGGDKIVPTAPLGSILETPKVETYNSPDQLSTIPPITRSPSDIDSPKMDGVPLKKPTSILGEILAEYRATKAKTSKLRNVLLEQRDHSRTSWPTTQGLDALEQQYKIAKAANHTTAKPSSNTEKFNQLASN